MRIGDSNRPTGTRRPGSAAAPAADSPSREAATPAARDSAAVMGIPANELSPKVREALIQLMAEVDRLRQENERNKARIAYLEQLADEDTLVPIANRRAFVRELSRTISFSQRYNAPSSIIYFDLNGLKAINDGFGHAAGDAALVHVANMLIENIRGSDLAARLGGDEFGVILAQADEKVARDKAAALAAAVAAHPLEFEGHTIALHLAYGVHTFRGGENPVEALAEADRAMYAQKQGTRSPPGR